MPSLCIFLLILPKKFDCAGWNECAGWKLSSKLINVQDLIRVCRVENDIEIYKRACTFIRYSRVCTNLFRSSASNGSSSFVCTQLKN